MENSPLNKAHQLERRAQALLRQKKFEECIECHRNAVKYLHDSLHLTTNVYANESIQLQIDNHHKQIESAKIKKTQYEENRRYQETIKHRMANFESICETGEALQNEIYRTMETHDSLIEHLIKHDDEVNSAESSHVGNIQVIGKKRQVDQETVVEEFRGLSEKLRELIQVLLGQLEDKDSEIARLKVHIHTLETDKNKGNNNEFAANKSNTLRVITDSSGGTSPYVISPCSELSPEVHDLLPPLAPLEMPSFDFSTLIKNTSSLNLNGST